MITDPLIWKDYEYIHVKKTADWYWAVGIISVALVIVPLLFNNIMLALLVAISAFSLMLMASKPAKLVEFEINNTGIRIGTQLFPFDTLDAYFISDESVTPTLLLQSQSMFMPLLSIPIQEVGEDVVESLLSSRLTKRQLREPLPQKILEYFGF